MVFLLMGLGCVVLFSLSSPPEKAPGAIGELDVAIRKADEATVPSIRDGAEHDVAASAESRRRTTGVRMQIRRRIMARPRRTTLTHLSH